MVYLVTKKVFLFSMIKSKSGISESVELPANWIWAMSPGQSESDIQEWFWKPVQQQWSGLSLLIEVDLHCAENASIIYRNYMLAICLIGFFGPLVIIIFCYARILGIMYSSEKKMRKGFRIFGDGKVVEQHHSWAPLKAWIFEIREKIESDSYSKAR